MVVVAIIALLISILLPSLAGARLQARAVKCATNLSHVGTAVATHMAEYNKYPVSYAYLDARGNFDPSNLYSQDSVSGHPYGYIHWSYYLYGTGKVKDESFQCPDFLHGGAPRTNPGPNPEDWEGGQVDDKGNSRPNPHVDQQAARMAFTANAAIMPRNKFSRLLSGGSRVNQLVTDAMLKRPSKTILVTELNNNWRASAVQQGGGLLSKSHRPVNPFYHVSSGSNEYAAPVSAAGRSGFIYGEPGSASGDGRSAAVES
jgi:hypothetical protein